ncbi:ribosome-associated translation inhibitor RaiA [Subsaximicrobium wynnwilliamsii]|jgi:putative sigma-54 modulation protein|uniref:Ribosome-associated translation inhibitor RaiA n=1 Tax=Subsaximicrobium wynnwilliamsii TaxID=291179 RepID=A0A5C6ZEV2_9FLAO|nr:ribosome-associated translation inhibitor RaiA [Subsaximicrobium wynnwilliamsii]TXD81321.1 ribosome-associated translation inhibitor RaiA [Subsaximicrobium wynnwilliamsii]TXD87310.1 ribosome-associated translation inhibitor RaiA [Subsaximicrobium wynnwilliamsii]TXE00915.1 ribosome-associated translation inhibitor RaiA [Subsaximicrobium wynnwilliamsii]
MTVNFQYVDVDVSESLSAFTEEKLDKLFNRYEFIVGADVFFKKDTNEPEKNKICNIRLSLPGPRLFATSSEKQYEVAVRETICDLERQLKKRKEIFKTH